jgi:hypothetical protein
MPFSALCLPWLGKLLLGKLLLGKLLLGKLIP